MPNRKAAGRNAVDAQDGRDIQDMEEAGAAVSQPAGPTTQSELNPYIQKKILIKGRRQRKKKSHKRVETDSGSSSDEEEGILNIC